MFTARYGLNLRVMYINPAKPSGHYMYHQFNIQHFNVLPTQCIYVFCVDIRKNSDYFSIQHKLTGFHNRDGMYYAARTGYLNIIQVYFPL